MWGKSARDIKFRGFPAIAAVSGIAILVAGLWGLAGRFTATSNLSIDGEGLTRSSQEVTEQPDKMVASSSLQTDAAISQKGFAQESTVKQKADPKAIAAKQGALRVGNESEYPVRVALLFKGSEADKKAPYEAPAHWDFDPEEGGETGLLLSLPNRAIKLQKGDVLVAFAQDGSRRYWGPYVVGETSLPVWSAKTGEWQLVISP